MLVKTGLNSTTGLCISDTCKEVKIALQSGENFTGHASFCYNKVEQLGNAKQTLSKFSIHVGFSSTGTQHSSTKVETD